MKKLLCLCILIVIYTSAISQKVIYKNLVLEGGGVRGFAYAGAFEILDSLGIMKGVERIGGTSAGAIQATLLAIGYSPKEIMDVAQHIPLKEFNDGFFPGGFSRLKRKFGFFKGENLGKWITNLIFAKTGDSNITFLQLHQLKAVKNYKDLYITGTDLTHRCLRVFSFENYPNMKIKDAVRISFSIPLYFEPVIIDDEGKVQHDIANKTHHVMVDGGLLANYPIQIFDSTRYIDTDTMTINLYKTNPFTLGLLLDKPEQVVYAKQGNVPLELDNINDYIKAVYQTLIDKPNPDAQTLKRTIIISHLNLSGRVRKLSLSTIEKLLESGRSGTRAFFFSSFNP